MHNDINLSDLVMPYMILSEEKCNAINVSIEITMPDSIALEIDLTSNTAQNCN